MNESQTSANRTYRCGQCGDSSDSEYEARIHARKHTGVRFEVLYPDATEAAARQDAPTLALKK